MLKIMVKSNDLPNAILRTLCYADVFDYPLTLEEVRRWLIGPLATDKRDEAVIQTALTKIGPQINQTEGYYYLRGRVDTIVWRKKRARYAREKLAIATKVGKWLGYIPTVRMVAVTGALAMRNTKESDDIDLMLITRSKRLWLTRLFVVALVSLISKRRKPEKQWDNETREQWKNAICLNLFLDEESLVIPPAKRNLYTAHEVVQSQPIINKNQTAERFLTKNQWVRQYLPHSLIANTKLPQQAPPKPEGICHHLSLISNLGNLLEQISYQLQMKIMESKRTTEIVQPHQAFFHPRNTGDLVLKGYFTRLKKYLSA